MSAKIIYKDIAVGASSDNVMAVNNKQPFSDLTQLNNELIYKRHSTIGELNQTVLDKSQLIFPNMTTGEYWGLWSLEQSSESGVFMMPPILSITFGDYYTSTGTTLQFDILNNLYASNVNIQWYRDSTLLSTKGFSPNEGLYFCDNSVERYNKIVIAFLEMNMPYCYLKLQSVLFGIVRIFMGDELRNVSILEETSLISEELSINTMGFTLSSKNPSTKYVFQKKQPLIAEFKDKLMGVYFIDTAKQINQGGYDVQAIDYIGLLDKVSFNGGMYVNKNVLNLLTEIFNIAKIPFDVELILQTKSITGYLPISTCREALMQVAFAIGAVVDTSRSDNVNVFTLNQFATEISEDRLRTPQSFDEKDKATEVQLTQHSYSVSTEITELYKGDVGNNIRVTFSEPCHSVSIVNGTVLELHINYAIINASVNCILTGKKYAHNTKMLSKKNTVIGVNDLENVISFEKCTLVSDVDVLTILYNYFVKQDYVNAKFRVDDEKVSNFIVMATEYLGDKQGYIESMKYNLNGNIIVADMRAKEI